MEWSRFDGWLRACGSGPMSAVRFQRKGEKFDERRDLEPAYQLATADGARLVSNTPRAAPTAYSIRAMPAGLTGP